MPLVIANPVNYRLLVIRQGLAAARRLRSTRQMKKKLARHVGLELSDGQMIMGSDMFPGMGPGLKTLRFDSGQAPW